MTLKRWSCPFSFSLAPDSSNSSWSIKGSLGMPPSSPSLFPPCSVAQAETAQPVSLGMTKSELPHAAENACSDLVCRDDDTAGSVSGAVYHQSEASHQLSCASGRKQSPWRQGWDQLLRSQHQSKTLNQEIITQFQQNNLEVYSPVLSVTSCTLMLGH